MTDLSINTASQLLRQLVGQAGWRNEQHAIVEALPHMCDVFGPDEIAQTLENLKIPYSRVRCKETRITVGECPALIFPNQQDSYIALGIEDGALRVWDHTTETEVTCTATSRVCDVIRIDRHRFDRKGDHVQTVADAFSVWRPMLPWLLFSSLLVNVLGLLAPLLIMTVYDRVIPSGSEQFLFALAFGVLIILATDFALRCARTKALAYVGRQGEKALSLALFQKLMALPLQQLQKSDVDQQVSRFRQFEGLRDVFTGQVVSTLLDLPFALIFLAVLFYLTPAVGLLTVCVCILLALLTVLTLPTRKRLDQKVAETAARSREIIQDSVLRQDVIANLGLQDTFRERSIPLIEEAEHAVRQSQQFQTTTLSIAQSLTSLATLGAIILSAYGAMYGHITFGALIAVIALVSKIIAPIHGLYANTPQILTFLQSRTQADRVLSLPQEIETGVAHSHQNGLRGKIALSNVTHRVDPLQPPVLSQASFTFEFGELVVIFGTEMTGRQAILDLIDGLYTPLAGSIEIDEIDIRQIARDELRRSVSYDVFEASLFYGTVTQNFRLAAPEITEAKIDKALAAIGLEAEVAKMPERYETRLTDAYLSKLPAETIKALTLARTIARGTPIFLFAEPTVGLSTHRRGAFKKWLKAEAGQRTIVISTADQSLLDLADRFIFLNQGRIAVNDYGEAGRKKLQAMLNAKGS